MKFLTVTSVLFLLYCLPAISAADPSPAKVISHPKSACIVESTSGEYPLYSVERNGKVIYAPKSDGIIKAVFSPDGRYIAFSGSEVNGVDIKPGAYNFSVVVLECNTGSLKGFTKGFPNPDLRWDGNNSLRYTDSATEREIRIQL